MEWREGSDLLSSVNGKALLSDDRLFVGVFGFTEN